MTLICENKRILKIGGFFWGGGQYFPGEWLVEALMEDTEIQNTPTTGVKVMQISLRKIQNLSGWQQEVIPRMRIAIKALCASLP